MGGGVKHGKCTKGSTYAFPQLTLMESHPLAPPPPHFPSPSPPHPWQMTPNKQKQVVCGLMVDTLLVVELGMQPATAVTSAPFSPAVNILPARFQRT